MIRSPKKAMIPSIAHPITSLSKLEDNNAKDQNIPGNMIKNNIKL